MFVQRFQKALLLLFFSMVSMSFFSACQPSAEPWKHIKLVTVPESQKMPLHFIALGDQGSGSAAQMDLAKAMADWYTLHPFPLALTLGDNIYDTGDVHKYGQSRFLKPYGPLLDQGVRFLPTLGNHDFWFANISDEIHFFHMPGPYYHYKVGKVHFFALDTDKFDDEQQAWLKKELEHDDSPWKIVYGHHPVFSSGIHGPSGDLQANLKPLLEKYHVNLYLCGHDHDYERFKPVNGVLYIVSGGGGARLRPFIRVLKGSVTRLKIHEFVYVTVDEDHLTVQSIGFKDKILDSVTISR